LTDALPDFAAGGAYAFAFGGALALALVALVAGSEWRRAHRDAAH
jgi:hypothetical protein